MELDTLNPISNIIISSSFPPQPFSNSLHSCSDIISNAYVTIQNQKEKTRQAAHATLNIKETFLSEHMANTSSSKTSDQSKSPATSSIPTESAKNTTPNDNIKPEKLSLKRLKYDESIDFTTCFKPRETPDNNKKTIEGPLTKFRKIGVTKKSLNIPVSQTPFINEDLNKLLLTHLPLSSKTKVPKLERKIFSSNTFTSKSIENVATTNSIHHCLSSIAEIESLFNLPENVEYPSTHNDLEFTSDIHNENAIITPLYRGNHKILNDLEKVRDFLRKLSSQEQPFGSLSIEGKIMTEITYTLLNKIQVELKSFILKYESRTDTAPKFSSKFSQSHNKPRNGGPIHGPIAIDLNKNPLKKKQLMGHKKKLSIDTPQQNERTHLPPISNSPPLTNQLEKDTGSFNNDRDRKGSQTNITHVVQPGYEVDFPRFVFGSIDRREAMDEHLFIHLKDPDKIITLCKVEIFLNPSTPSRWFDSFGIPTKLEINQNIQIASKKSGIPHRFWRDAKITGVSSQEVLASIKFPNQEAKNFSLKLDDFIPPRFPCLEPSKGSWRLQPKHLSPSTDLYIGACICVSSVDSPQVLNDCVVQSFFFDEKHVPRRRSRPAKNLPICSTSTTDTKDTSKEASSHTKSNSIEDSLKCVYPENSSNTAPNTIKNELQISSDPSQEQLISVKEGQMPQEKVSWIKIFYLASRKEELLAVNELLHYKMPYDLQPHLEDVSTKMATLKSLNSTMFWTLPRYSQMKNLESDSKQILKLESKQSEPSQVSLSQLFQGNSTCNTHTHFIIYISLELLSTLPKKSYSKLIQFLHPELHDRPKDYWLQAWWLGLFNPHEDSYYGIPRPYWETSHKRDDNCFEPGRNKIIINEINHDDYHSTSKIGSDDSLNGEANAKILKKLDKNNNVSHPELITKKPETSKEATVLGNTSDSIQFINAQISKINHNNTGYSYNHVSDIYEDLNFSPLEDDLPTQKCSNICPYKALDEHDFTSQTNPNVINQTNHRIEVYETSGTDSGLLINSKLEDTDNMIPIEVNCNHIENSTNKSKDLHDLRRNRRLKLRIKDATFDQKNLLVSDINNATKGNLESNKLESCTPSPPHSPPTESTSIDYSNEIEPRLLKIQWDEDIELS